MFSLNNMPIVFLASANLIFLGIFLAYRLGYLKLQNISAIFGAILPISIFDFSKVEVGVWVPSAIFLFVPPAILIFFMQLRTNIPDFWRDKSHLFRREIFWVLWFGLAGIFSIINSSDLLYTILEVSQLILFFSMYILISNLFRSQKQYLTALNIYIFVCTLIILSGLIFYRQNSFVRLELFGARANRIGIFIEQALIAAVGLLFVIKDYRKKIISVLAIAILLIGLILTFSRGAWLSSLFGILIIIFLSRRHIKSRPLIIIFLAFLFIVSILGIGFVNFYEGGLDLNILARNVQRFEASNDLRIKIWTRAAEEVLDNPLFGNGYGNRVDVNYKKLSSKGAHNSYLGVLNGSGIVGFVFMTAFLITHLYNTSIVRTQIINDRHNLGNISIAMFLTLLAHMVVENTFSSSYFWALLVWQGALINCTHLEKALND